MGNWLKDKAAAAGAAAATLAAFVAILQIFVVGPLNKRFDMMERHADRRIGGLATLMNQRFQSVDQRLQSVDQRFADLATLMDERFKAVDQRFDAVEQRFKAVDQRFETVNRRFDAVDRRLDRLADEVGALRGLTVSIGERVARNEGRIEIIMEQTGAVEAPPN